MWQTRIERKPAKNRLPEAVSKLWNASHIEQRTFWPFQLHSEGCSQSCVSFDCAQKAFGTQCTSSERSAHARVLSAVRHTKAKAVH